MKEDAPSHEKTSRRRFTKAVVTAAVAAPIAATLACKSDSSTLSTNNANAAERAKAAQTPNDPCELKVVHQSGYTQTSWEVVPPEDHIPPMGLEGGGSLIIDSKNVFREDGSGQGPYTYDENPDSQVNPPNYRYGDIQSLTIITETEAAPYLSHAYYNAFQPGTQLWIWYQDIKGTASGDDTEFDPNFDPANPGEPNIKINGGRGANRFKIVVKRKKFDADKSHRKNRPNRYRHVNVGAERHFRIGLWQVLNSAGTVLFTGNRADNYRFYIEFGHYQP